MSHGFERMKKDTMPNSNQTSQPAGSDREEVLKVYPKAVASYHNCGMGSSYWTVMSGSIELGRAYCGAMTDNRVWADARSRLPNAPAPQASIALHPSLTPEIPADFAPEPVKKYVPEWVQRVDLAIWPIDYTASAPAYDRPPDPTPKVPEPVGQGDQPEITNEIEIRWRKGFVCAGPFIRENARWTPDQADQFADYLRSAAQSAREQTTSSPAPSQSELPADFAPETVEQTHLTSDGTCMDCNRTDCVCEPEESPELAQAVEQGEQKEGFYETLDRKCWENSGTAQLLRERPENLHDYQGCVNDPKMQPSPSAPSEPEQEEAVDPCPNCGQSPCSPSCKYYDPEFDAPAETELLPLDVTQEDTDKAKELFGGRPTSLLLTREIQDIHISRSTAELFSRERQLLAAMRENQQLRQQVKDVDKSAKSLYLALYQCGVVIEFVPGSPKIRNQRAETAEQQLAQKGKRIAELEGGKA